MVAASRSSDPRLARAIAAVPREMFLPPGPWTLIVGGGRVRTPSADPVHLYQNVLVALDEAQGINNGEPFLLREAGSGSRHAIDRYLETNGRELNVRFSLASNEVIRELVISGMGLAVLSRHSLGDSVERGEIVILKVKDFPLRQPWSIVRLRSKVLSLPAQAFMDALLRTGIR